MKRPPKALPGLVLAVAVTALPAQTPARAAELRFQEVSEAWGLDFRHHHGGSGEYYMVETMGSGVAVFDYDGDGDQDVFFVDGAALPGYEGETPRSVLLRNDPGPGGEPRFVDVTERAGLVIDGGGAYGMGVAAADHDGDGDVDLYLTAFGPNHLFENRGDGTFADVTESAGVGDGGVGASAAFADVDRDGDLDLYVANYVGFTLEGNVICGNQARGIRTYCHPDSYEGQHDVFYSNRLAQGGAGTFTDATEAAGFGAADGKGLGVVFSDFDQDGWPDLYVANDMTANFLFRNRGGDDQGGPGTFEEIGLLSGTAYNERGNAEAGMGVEVADLEGDGGSEIVVTHMDDQTNAVYGLSGPWVFADRRYASRLAEPSVGKVGFGVVAADYDQDADLDVVVANGHIIDNIELLDPRQSFRQPNQAFENTGGGRFREVEEAGFTIARSSRGMAAGDLDGDGDLDLVVSNSNEPAEAYENTTPTTGGWLQVTLVDPDSANWNGIGARVTVEAGGKSQWREVRTGSSYQSQNALPVHFGLGEAETAKVTVRWPDGTRQTLDGVPASRSIRIER